MGNLVHHNTSSFLHFVKDFTQGSKEYLNKKNLSYTTMLYYDLYQERIDKTEFKDAGMYKALDILHEEEYRYFKQEMAEIVSYRLENLEITTSPLGDTVLPGIELYGCYTREEIFTLTGRQTESHKILNLKGTFNLPQYNATLLFVTLNKSDRDFHLLLNMKTMSSIRIISTGSPQTLMDMTLAAGKSIPDNRRSTTRLCCSYAKRRKMVSEILHLSTASVW